jgi:hypothetical protein
VHASAALARTVVSVDPVVAGRLVIQNGGYRIGGSVSVDSTGIQNIDLRLGQLVHDGWTPTESAAAAWDRAARHKAGADDEMYLEDT